MTKYQLGLLYGLLEVVHSLGESRSRHCRIERNCQGFLSNWTRFFRTDTSTCFNNCRLTMFNDASFFSIVLLNRMYPYSQKCCLLLVRRKGFTRLQILREKVNILRFREQQKRKKLLTAFLHEIQRWSYIQLTVYIKNVHLFSDMIKRVVFALILYTFCMKTTLLSCPHFLISKKYWQTLCFENEKQNEKSKITMAVLRIFF